MGAHPSPAPSPSSFPAAPAPRGLAELDERIANGTTGVVIAWAPPEAHAAILAHAARRARAADRIAIIAREHDGAPMWRDVASRLSLPRVPTDPTRCAEPIANAATLRRAAIVALLPRAGTWDRAVAAEIAALPNAPLVVFVTDADDPASDLRHDRFDIGATLDGDAKRRWWDALASEARASASSDELAALESWWATMKQASLVAPSAIAGAVPSEARALFEALALAGRAWPAAEIAAIGGDAASLAALVACGAARVVAGWVTIASSHEESAREAAKLAGGAACVAIAEVLASGPDTEPWAFARAADLFVRGDGEASLASADRAIARALSIAEDPIARSEIGARWMRAIEAVDPSARRELLVRTAERALTAGEPQEARRCAQMAAALADGSRGTSEEARVLLLLGRASTALGDLVAARVALDRARSIGAGDASIDALVSAEHAEIAYLAGDVAAARAQADAAIAGAPDRATELKARNTLGKLLLSEAKWDDADRHFAEDTLLASAQHDVTAELRARLNRAIALLSKGLMDESRAVFEAVLDEGERRGESRACAYALSNLGVVAMRRHEYGAALGYWERTIKLLHVMRDRMAAARTLANLADLRQELGLFDHAEHALGFGRRTLGPGMTSGRAAHFGVVAARVALARGRALDARREIEAAIVEAESSGDRDFLGEAFRVATRVALDDGDLPRATVALGRARELATQDLARAEVTLLHAMIERAAGREDLASASEALRLARTADKEALVRETHALLAEIDRGAGRIDAARGHVLQAIAVRDKVAASLPDDVRAAFLARPDVVSLARLHTLLAEPSSPRASMNDVSDFDDAPRSVRSARAVVSTPREIVGDDPAVRGLLVAIKKVARSSSTVLVRGESGTGKELVAEALHRASERAGGPLVTVNCAALVETLLLSELFGHERGAFTGASARRRGRFELAEGGTLFLDEIGDISPRTQVALLRVLQERTFERVGGTTPIRANVRIVCATHRDLRAMVERGEFREDLYYRLRGITLEVPALRARMGDLPRIADHLLHRIAVERDESAKTLAIDALDLLARHRWPGNVRELENALRAASLFAEADVIHASDLVDNVDDLRAVASSGSSPRAIANAVASSPHAPESDVTLDGSDDADAPLPLGEANATAIAYSQVRQGAVSLSDIKRQIERDCIARALAETKGNITRAAALLGMKRPRLSQLVKQYGLAAVSSEAG